MLYGVPTGPAPAAAPGAWPVVPVTLALLLLILTGVAWPPGLGDALDQLAAIVATEMALHPLDALTQALVEAGAHDVNARGTDQVDGRLAAVGHSDAGRAARRPRRSRSSSSPPSTRASSPATSRSSTCSRSPALRPRAAVLVSLDAAQPRFPSLATRSFAASRFEREVHDLFGLVPRGHPDLRRLALHQFWPAGYHPLRRDAVPRDGSDRRGPAVSVPSRRGRGHLRDHRRPGARRHHRARPLPLQRRGRDDRQPRDPAGLRPQGHREALRDAAVGADAGARRAHLRRHERRPRARLLPGARSAGRRRRPAARALAARRAARAGAALQPRGRRRHDRQRHGLRLRPRALLPAPRGAAAAERAR